ncbi:MAG: hypothetical protein QXY45_00205 [Candidatus Aenigmatarchaeota archaeon]
MGDPLEDEAKRLEEDLKRKEKMEQEKLEYERKLREEQQKGVEKLKSDISSDAHEGKSSIGKYVVIIAVFIIIGIVIWKFYDDITWVIKRSSKNLGSKIPADFKKYLYCLTGRIPWESCFSQNPPQQLITHKVLSMSFPQDLETPKIGKKYMSSIKIKNLKEGEVYLKDVKSKIVCTKRVEGVKKEESYMLEPKSLPKKIGSREVNILLETQENLPCNLISCDNIQTEVVYEYSSYVKNNFNFVKNERDISIKEEYNDAPVGVSMVFEPNNYYLYGDLLDKIRIELRVKNYGSGRAEIKSMSFKKIGDDRGFMTLEGCSCPGLGIEFKDDGREVSLNDEKLLKDQVEYCRCSYNINSPLDFKEEYKTIIFSFDLGYNYREFMSRSDLPKIIIGEECEEENNI